MASDTCKIRVSHSFFNWVKNEMTLNRISELMLATLIQRYDKKSIISFQEQETHLNFTGCQVPHFIILLILYIDLLNLSWIIKSIFEEYGAFNRLHTTLFPKILMLDLINFCVARFRKIHLRILHPCCLVIQFLPVNTIASKCCINEQRGS